MKADTGKRLTPKQNCVINCLQHGWQIITSTSPGALICNETHQFEITNTLFYNLVDLDLIYQSLDHKRDRYRWLLTTKGRQIKTRDTELTKPRH